MILAELQQVLRATHLRRLVVATSGGPDSQVLLHALGALQTSMELTLWAVGIDHGLRSEAPAELDLAEALATQLGVPFARRRVTLRPGNLMAEARRARYAALEEARLEVGAQAVAAAHTASDQAETLLMRLARGTSLRGAGGMAAHTPTLLRPLLEITREQVLAYAREHHIPYASDPTNVDGRFTRARIRHEVLGPLQRLSPAAPQHLARFATWAQQDEAVLHELAAQRYREALGAGGGLSCAAVRALPEALRRRVLAMWLEDHGVPASLRHLETLAEAITPGSAWRGTFQQRPARVEAEYLWLEGASQGFSQPLPLPGRVELPGGGWFLEAQVMSEPPPASLWRHGVAFDLDRLHLELRISTWRPGDHLQPSGMTGHVKVSDLFANAKIPRSMRKSWPLLRHGDDVVWVAGLRRGATAQITGDTQRVLHVHLEGGAPLESVLG